MLLVIPVSAADSDLVNSTIRVFKHLGPQGNHPVLVMATPGAAEPAQKLFQGIQGLFASVTLKVLDTEPTGGWPTACNQHFKETAYFIFQNPQFRSQPWYWFELDCTPLVPGWLDKLAEEYAEAGKPFMGVVHPTFFTVRHDSKNPRQKDFPVCVQQDYHMVGTGIYPGDFWERSVMVRFMATAFDVEIQYEVVPHCHPTQLIQHNWGTVRYRRTQHSATKIVCDAKDPHISPIDHAQPVRSDAVVLHGCKDGSLADIVCRKRFSPR